jgi:hypothetical protein
VARIEAALSGANSDHGDDHEPTEAEMESLLHDFEFAASDRARQEALIKYFAAIEHLGAQQQNRHKQALGEAQQRVLGSREVD